MCGIAGSTEDRDGARAAAMATAMVHRGPDDEGMYVDPDSAVSLSARRLSIIDVAGGHQPISNEDGSVWAVLNGEIYNHAALREQLIRGGHVFRSHTDTEVLVHLYERYGQELVHAVEGMYAFAIWDRSERMLVLVRDRFGEKPLYYTQNDAGGLVFASELTAVRAGLHGEPAIDPEALDAFFVLGYVPGERTAFQGIRQLPPASVLRCSMETRKIEVQRYWSMPSHPLSRRDSVATLAEEGGELLSRSVRSRLVADVPVGVFLSGGLDSTLVTSMAAAEASASLKTFTVAYDTGGVGEAQQARATAAQLGSHHHEVILSSADIAGRVGKVMGALDQPNADPALVALHAVAEEARRSVTVAVGGEGADELFGGYPRYRWMQRAAFSERHLPAGLARISAAAIGRSLPGRAARLADVLRPVGLAERQLDWVTAGRRHARAQLYGPRLRECLSRDIALEDIASLLSANGHRGPVGQLMALDQRRYLPDDVLAKADRATMLVSLEMRTPYLSRELAEFSATIPTSTHLADGGKAVLREIARRQPGISGTRRVKKAFRVPMPDWLAGPLLPLLREVADGPLVHDGWIDGPALRARIEAHAASKSDESAILWSSLAMGLWIGAQ